MKAVNFTEVNFILGANQDEYFNLPVYAEPGPEGYVHFKFKLSEAELDHLQRDPHIHFCQMTFNKGFSPVRAAVIPHFEVYKPKDWPDYYSTLLIRLKDVFGDDNRVRDNFISNCIITAELLAVNDIVEFEFLARKEYVRQRLADIESLIVTPTIETFYKFEKWATETTGSSSLEDLFGKEKIEGIRKKIRMNDRGTISQN